MSCLAIQDKGSSSSIECIEDSFSRPRSLPSTPGRCNQSVHKIPDKHESLETYDQFKKRIFGCKKLDFHDIKECRVVISPLKWPTNNSQNETQSKGKNAGIGNSPVY